MATIELRSQLIWTNQVRTEAQYYSDFAFGVQGKWVGRNLRQEGVTLAGNMRRFLWKWPLFSSKSVVTFL